MFRKITLIIEVSYLITPYLAVREHSAESRGLTGAASLAPELYKLWVLCEQHCSLPKHRLVPVCTEKNGAVTRTAVYWDSESVALQQQTPNRE